MLKALAQVFGGKRKERTKELHDALLGTLRLAEGDWWEATIEVEGKKLGFKIGGDRKPDTALIEHAHDIVRSFAQFDRMVAEFLASEAQRMPRASDEIRQLMIEDVMLRWPKRPDDGMIYFKGPDQYRVWRCDYVGRKPRGLGFDD
jgi:hypothetical protein